ncbi:hypothetical protein E1301_Tti007921 [Triplophysa tibetana]|uniref:TRAF-type domain-containing protein n=1 Tax=Triplophysa tibetana TaxID=1572043 RepID=A0A5A9MZ09_9TELE|nr:hypothetical protein E1301_Tti007921 [Triplophysa tibetana]
MPIHPESFWAGSHHEPQSRWTLRFFMALKSPIKIKLPDGALIGATERITAKIEADVTRDPVLSQKALHLSCQTDLTSTQPHNPFLHIHNKEVAKANYDVHEPHCQRFLCLCPGCDETIPRDQLEDHKAEEHAETDECQERLKSCEYCELELPLSGLLKHSLSCGSRTSPCSDCGRYVQFQHQHLHALECSNGPLTVKNPRPEDDETVG